MTKEGRAGKHVPVEELVDLEALGTPDRPPTARELRAALPRGWALDEDGRTAHRDTRLLFREGWVLLLGLVLFGAAAVVFFWEVLPGGWSGLLRVVLLIAVVLVAAGLVAPGITRALHRR